MAPIESVSMRLPVASIPIGMLCMARLLGEFDTMRALQAGWMSGLVEAVSQRSAHSFSKQPSMWIRLLAGLGVEGDAHLGATVKHRSRVARDPAHPNLRQVHLLHRELLDALGDQGF